MATVLPDREPRRFLGIDPDLMAFLWAEALRTSVANSAGVRSAIESRCLGAKGEVGGVEGEEYCRN